MKTTPFALALALVFGGFGAALAPAQKGKPAPKPRQKPGASKPGATKPAAPVTIEVSLADGDKLTPLKDGQTISGDLVFRAKVGATEPVTSVEFYVGDDLRDTDGSTPYEFKFDALAEGDGSVRLTFKGYTSAGTSATRVLTVKVDNGLGLGLDEHLRRGADALSNARNDEALTEGRIALKIAPTSVPARVLVARAYLAKGVFDRAQKSADDALAADPKSTDALEVSAAIGVQRAFRVTNSGTTARDESLRTIKDALGGAIDARTKVNDARFEGLAADAATKDLAGYADAAFGARRYSSAIAALDPAFRADTTKTALGNRLVYAYLMDGNPASALQALNALVRFGKPDAYTYALQGLLRAEGGDDKGADESFKNGALESADSLGLRTAQASVALKKNRTAALQGIANGLAKDVSSRPEINYYLAAVSNRLQRYDVSRRNFEAAVRVDPASHDMYLEQGSQALGLATNPRLEAKEKAYNLQSARTMFDLALRARPSSAYALAGLSIVSLLEKKTDEAVTNARSAVAAGPNVAVAHFVLSGALSAKRKEYLARLTSPDAAVRDAARSGESQLAGESRGELAKAATLDRTNLEGRLVPDGEEAYRYLSTSGRQPVLTPPSRG